MSFLAPLRSRARLAALFGVVAIFPAPLAAEVFGSAAVANGAVYTINQITGAISVCVSNVVNSQTVRGCKGVAQVAIAPGEIVFSVQSGKLDDPVVFFLNETTGQVASCTTVLTGGTYNTTCSYVGKAI